MIRVTVKNQEVELSFPQILEVVKQLKPEEKNIVRRALEDRSWSTRVDDLLDRVWTRVEKSPLADEDINAEIKTVRQTLFDARRH